MRLRRLHGRIVAKPALFSLRIALRVTMSGDVGLHLETSVATAGKSGLYPPSARRNKMAEKDSAQR